MSDARIELLRALADDELLIGSRDAEWSGVAPLLEEDVALSSIAQDEVGHALALYELLALELGGTADGFVYGRSAGDLRHARILERSSRDFAFTIARRFAYEVADRLRMKSLEESSWDELAALAAKMSNEETLHLDHARWWVARLTAAEPGKSRMRSAFREVLPKAHAILSPLPVDAELVEDGTLPVSWSVLREEWRKQMRAALEPIGFAELLVVEVKETDRYGGPSDDAKSYLKELGMVRAMAPESTW